MNRGLFSVKPIFLDDDPAFLQVFQVLYHMDPLPEGKKLPSAPSVSRR